MVGAVLGELHFVEEALAGFEVEVLEGSGVAGGFQDVGDPFGPLAVFAGAGDEEMVGRGHGVVLSGDDSRAEARRHDEVMAKRRHECRRGRHECPRHKAGLDWRAMALPGRTGLSGNASLVPIGSLRFGSSDGATLV